MWQRQSIWYIGQCQLLSAVEVVCNHLSSCCSPARPSASLSQTLDKSLLDCQRPSKKRKQQQRFEIFRNIYPFGEIWMSPTGNSVTVRLRDCDILMKETVALFFWGSAGHLKSDLESPDVAGRQGGARAQTEEIFERSCSLYEGQVGAQPSLVVQDDPVQWDVAVSVLQLQVFHPLASRPRGDFIIRDQNRSLINIGSEL